MRVLAGDVGGTKTRLAVVEAAGHGLERVVEEAYPSADYAGLSAVVAEFLRAHPVEASRAGFGIAGPVTSRRVRTTNLPWIIDADAMERELGLERVELLNDLEATAYGLRGLGEADLRVLHDVPPDPRGNVAVVAAGTGLGEAGIHRADGRERPFATEGGHVGFGPENDTERALAAWMAERGERVTWERVLSGPALPGLLAFVGDHEGRRPTRDVRDALASEDPAAVVSRAGLDGSCPACRRALELFVALYGSEAGNAGLKLMARGGVYLAGGVAPKIADALAWPAFREAFLAKEPMAELVRSMPVRLVLNEATALLGAARRAADDSEGGGR